MLDFLTQCISTAPPWPPPAARGCGPVHAEEQTPAALAILYTIATGAVTQEA